MVDTLLASDGHVVGASWHTVSGFGQVVGTLLQLVGGAGHFVGVTGQVVSGFGHVVVDCLPSGQEVLDISFGHSVAITGQ